MSVKQNTIGAPITFSGKGLHTGKQVTMTGVAKKPEQFGKAMLLPAMVETFALFAFLISFLAVAGVGGAGI